MSEPKGRKATNDDGRDPVTGQPRNRKRPWERRLGQTDGTEEPQRRTGYLHRDPEDDPTMERLGW